MKPSPKISAGIAGILLFIFTLQALATPIIQSNTITINEIKHNYWMTICGDNQSIIFNQNLAEDYCTADQNNSATNCTAIQGLYTESIKTSHSHSQCITTDDSDNALYDTDCIIQTCTNLIEFNQLTGETQAVWTMNEGWISNPGPVN